VDGDVCVRLKSVREEKSDSVGEGVAGRAKLNPKRWEGGRTSEIR